MESINPRTVAGEIRANLARQGKNQSFIAGVLGKDVSVISRRLSGHIPFTLEEISAIAVALEVPVESLLGGVAA
jgi:transcriptional regulator with XRE-family HTH domain